MKKDMGKNTQLGSLIPIDPIEDSAPQDVSLKYESLLCSQFSAYAYLEEGELRAKLLSIGYELESQLSAPSNTGVYLARSINQKEIVIAFRGTQPTSIPNWNTNLFIELTPLVDGKPYEVPSGFLNAYNGVEKQLIEQLNSLLTTIGGPSKLERFYIAGHSLGGALATLAVVSLSEYLKSYSQWKWESDAKILKMYNYGAPPIGNLAFRSELYDPLVGGRFYSARFLNPLDPVPQGLGVMNEERGYYNVINSYHIPSLKGESPISAHGIHRYVDFFKENYLEQSWIRNSEFNNSNYYKERYIDLQAVKCPEGKIVTGINNVIIGNRLAPALYCCNSDGTNCEWIHNQFDASKPYLTQDDVPYIDTTPITPPYHGGIVKGFAYVANGNRVAPNIFFKNPKTGQTVWCNHVGENTPNYFKSPYQDAAPVQSPSSSTPVLNIRQYQKGNRLGFEILSGNPDPQPVKQKWIRSSEFNNSNYYKERYIDLQAVNCPEGKIVTGINNVIIGNRLAPALYCCNLDGTNCEWIHNQFNASKPYLTQDDVPYIDTTPITPPSNDSVVIGFAYVQNGNRIAPNVQFQVSGGGTIWRNHVGENTPNYFKSPYQDAAPVENTTTATTFNIQLYQKGNRMAFEILGSNEDD
ncbi:lipase family protein [Microbulbifer sp. MLAF003]|uniref:lipase family protein n=1 Tax=Microbulbifer sp. MLAF003 TaxID=3032582 RepID=UPI0024AD44DC|nr:lipase family protein [Microbulbifer sp. MLAF003]WHI52725.1 lipase family protein [Microbulbifer sp. MLAF003]